jgi:hypothetical protein
MRTSMSMEEFYTLLTFSNRAAVFAMREKSVVANPDQLFRDAGKLSEPDVATLLTGFVERSAEEKDIRASWDTTKYRPPMGSDSSGLETRNISRLPILKKL